MRFQFLPRLTDDEYAALEKSIIEHGIQVPIIVDEQQSVIDGHHRKEIADRLGIHCPRRLAMDLDETQKRTLALSLNLDRRHLNREQKRELIERSIVADPQLSNRQHAERTGASPTTVGGARTRLEESGDVSKLDTLTDSLGRQQPTRVDRESDVKTFTPEPEVDAETGEVADDYVTDQAELDNLPDATTGEEVTPAEALARADDAVEEAPGSAAGSCIPAARPVTEGKPRRTPLTDSITNAVLGAETKLTTLRDLTRDDRWSRNAKEVAPRLRNDLLRLSALLEQVTNALPTTTEQDSNV